jgi:amino acid permease
MLTGLAFVICLLALVRPEEPYRDLVNEKHFHHLGTLLFAFVMLWTYMGFGQLLIIYSGNLPHEIGWYLHRIATNWKVIVWFLFLFHFAIPFFLLLSRDLKMKVGALTAICLVLLFAHLVNDYWLVAPSFYKHGIMLHWLDVAAPVGIGGIWLSAFCARLKGRALLVSNDPRQPHRHEPE